jgi:biopolymer transport protein ExbD
MRRHRKNLDVVSQINLTSLLDVAFVLLVAFMIVAPSLKYGFDLDLPTITEGVPQLTQGQNQLYTIAVPKPKAGVQEYFVNDTPSQLRDIEERLRVQVKQGSKVSVEIQADREVPYATFVQVIGAVRRAGIESIGLPLEAQPVDAPSPKKAPDDAKPRQVSSSTEPAVPTSKVTLPPLRGGAK